MSLNMNADTANIEKPKHNSQRIRILPTSRPTMNVVTNAAQPRGLIA